jgi:hypothetical protein
MEAISLLWAELDNEWLTLSDSVWFHIAFTSPTYLDWIPLP